MRISVAGLGEAGFSLQATRARHKWCASDSRPLKPAVIRIGDGQDDGGKAGGAGGEEDAGEGAEGGAGGHDIVDEDDMPAANGGGVDQDEGVAEVFHAFGAGVEMGLGFGPSPADDGIDAGDFA